MVKIKANANFHTATGKTVFDVQNNKRFLEYRKKWHEYPNNFIVGDFPMHLDIESTAACNLRCPFCATTFKNWGPKNTGFMDMDLFRKIIDEGAKNGLCSIKLSLRGEPLLHPRIIDMITYAMEKDILDIYFNTNAVLLDDNTIGRLIDAGLPRISISFEGTTKEVYEKYRVGAEYEKVISNVKKLKNMRDSRNTLYPQIRVQTVSFPEFKATFGEYVKFWETIADEVSYLDARSEKSDDDHRGMVAEWACPFLWQRMVVLWDGTLLPCLMHGVSDFDLMSQGNAREVSIKEKWLSMDVSRYRKLHTSGRAHEIEACDRCSYRAMELEKLGIKQKKGKI